MQSAVNSIFIVKYDFFKKDNIPQYAKVIIITIINNSCLIEDITPTEKKNETRLL